MPKAREVVQFDMEGKPIMIYPSAKYASRHLLRSDTYVTGLIEGNNHGNTCKYRYNYVERCDMDLSEVPRFTPEAEESFQQKSDRIRRNVSHKRNMSDTDYDIDEDGFRKHWAFRNINEYGNCALTALEIKKAAHPRRDGETKEEWIMRALECEFEQSAHNVMRAFAICGIKITIERDGTDYPDGYIIREKRRRYAR